MSTSSLTEWCHSASAIERSLVEIELDVADAVAVIKLNAPARKNALTPTMAESLSAVLAEVERDSTVAVAVIEGAGDYFCSGADRGVLAAAGADPAGEQAFRDLDTIYRSFTDLARIGVPTIAAVRGGAVGAGLNLALAADVRIVATDAILQSGFLRIGVHPGGGHFQLLERLVGPELTVAMTIFGQPLDGTGSVRHGLALEAVPSADVGSRCRELAAMARDADLVRAAISSFRAQMEAQGVPSAVGVRAEQAVQMWSLRRSLKLV
jgi:enoyl-CoA hydratase